MQSTISMDYQTRSHETLIPDLFSQSSSDSLSALSNDEYPINRFSPPRRFVRKQSLSPNAPSKIEDMDGHQERCQSLFKATEDCQVEADYNECQKSHENANASTMMSNDCQVGGIANQADWTSIGLECLIVPFARDLEQMELRIPSEILTKEHKTIIKTLASELQLVVLPLGANRGLDGKKPEMIIRKRAKLLEIQKALKEEKLKREAEAKAAKLEQVNIQKEYTSTAEAIQVTQQSPWNEGFQRVSGCQTGHVGTTDAKVESNRKRSQRLRKQLRKQRLAQEAEANRPKPQMVETGCQTVPEDHWLCPWCWEHIAPAAHCGHEAICRAGVLQRRKERQLKARLDQHNLDAEVRRRLRRGLWVSSKAVAQTKSNLIAATGVAIGGGGTCGRSRSRTRLAEKERQKSRSKTRASSKSGDSVVGNVGTRKSIVVAQLESIHHNDLEAMTRLMRNLCSEPGCKQLANNNNSSSTVQGLENQSTPGGKCPTCRRTFCPIHRPTEKHSSCSSSSPTTVNGEAGHKAGESSVASGPSADEKREALKSAIRQRRTALRDLRTAN